MRVFHFVKEEYGLENIRRRRLKVATLKELNDPFELFGANLRDEGLRRAFRELKDEWSFRRGFLCFSRNWHNPVQWSHYAAKHTGLCLGFDVPDDALGRVSYSRRRVVVQVESLRDPEQLDYETAKSFLFTKYSHWRYEDEVRCFVALEEKDPERDLYFIDFSDKLCLRQVIVGSESSVSRAVLREALGDLANMVDSFKARLAFRTFRVARQRNERLWA